MILASSSRKTSATETRVVSRNARLSSSHKKTIIGSEINGINVSYSKENKPNYAKRNLVVATWNATSLVSDSSKLQQLTYNMDKYGLDVLGITETHMPGIGSENLDNGGLIIYSGRADGYHYEGIGLALSKRTKDSLINSTPVSERIMTARLASKQINISIIVAYAPTETSTKKSKDAFYKLLDATYCSLPDHDVKLLMGDLNARVGQTTSSPSLIGQHSLHDFANDNGSRFQDFCVLHDLAIGGTLFQHPDIHKATWLHPNGNSVSQIDHICINRKWRNSLLDVRSYRGADIVTTHYLVHSQLKLKFRRLSSDPSSEHQQPARWFEGI